ncbi:MAG: glycosyltransferase, partial [Candidatus Omnitrophota bacterium]
YDRKTLVKNLAFPIGFANRIAFRKLLRLVRNLNPSCFVATQAFPCGIVADFKKKSGLKIPLIAVVTDYIPHRFWVHPSIDKYVVACQEAKEILIREGISDEKIKILGIPISVKFLNFYSKDEISDSLGFIRDLPSVLIMGGGLGLGSIEKIAETIDVLDCDFQIIVICGKNRKLYKWFVKNKLNFRKPIFYFSYIGFVHKIMDFADIIITKAGGITISEALSKGSAIVVANPIPGQEERNVSYLLKKRAIIKTDESSKIGESIRELLEDKKKMYSLKEKAKGISLIDSSLRIVDLILGEIS